MASHHHLRHHPAAASYCCCCPPYSSCHHHPPPPPPPDHHPFYHQPPQPSSQIHLPDSHQYHTRFRERYLMEERDTQATIASLLRRIAALESALRGRSSAATSRSLRDAAARTIQSHFRAFLLRRSRTLRQLKDLASIKSALGVLKSSVTKQIHSDYDLIYQQAMVLALELDTVQGGDPMIRDGKSLVKKDLIKFMDFLDGFYVRRVSSSSGVNMTLERRNSNIRVPKGGRKMVNVKSGDVKSVTMEKLRGLVERIDKIAEELDEDEESKVVESPEVFMKKHCVSGSKNMNLAKQLYGVRPKVKKSVSFADDGKFYCVLGRNSEPILNDDDDDDDDDDRVKLVSRDFEDNDVCREVEEDEVSLKEADDEEDEEEARLENDNNAEKTTYEGNFERRICDNQGEEDGTAFSAPLPFTMETRSTLMDKRKKMAHDL
ncbi:BAG family molecular chaperone regulator 8-chloroplastic [Striga hermonthica]|uniref:BAG family molecular chaperone regulator 8-chloroplastic n=1 Tax=Striga hermonthica TaxID=68872 RepID=A0A9N7REY6_STRHE|nr:BAG family molecular chaperone regulator 8-chloroplastic [Striga hermonthica]